MSKEPKYVEVAKYVLANNASKEQTIKQLKLTNKQLYDLLRNIKKNDANIYNQIVLTFERKEASKCIINPIVGVKSNQSKTNKKIKQFKYLQIAAYILTGNSVEQAAKHFNMKVNAVHGNIFQALKRNEPDIYDKVIIELNKQRNNNYKYTQISKWVIANNASRAETMKHFNIPSTCITHALERLKVNNKNDELEQILKIFWNTKDRQYVKVVQYMVDNNVGIHKAARALNVNPDSASSDVGYVKANFPDLYEKLVESRVNRSLKGS
jgi:hypothetical protein